MTRDKLTMSRADLRKINKIKTPFATIIVGGTAEKPYYSILWLDKGKKEYNVGYSSFCLEFVFKWLEEEFEIAAADEAPKEDVAPVRHGKWEHTHTHESYYDECWRCSVCGFDDTEGFGTNFCPDCGAKMDLEAQHD